MTDNESAAERAQLEADLAKAISALAQGAFSEAQVDDAMLVLLAQLEALYSAGVDARTVVPRMMALLDAMVPGKMDRLLALETLAAAVMLLVKKKSP